MNRLLTSTTDQVDVPSRRHSLFSGSDVLEDANVRPGLVALWQESAFHGLLGELTVQHIESFVRPQDATEWLAITSVPAIAFGGHACFIFGARDATFLRFNPRENSSDFTSGSIRDHRWMSIVQEELGSPTNEVLVDKKADPELPDTATADCVMFCREHAILDDLRKCLAKVEEVFSNVVSVTAELDQFPSDEYEEEGHVVIRIELASGQDEAFQDYDSYMDWMLDNVAGEKKQYFFVIFHCAV